MPHEIRSVEQLGFLAAAPPRIRKRGDAALWKLIEVGERDPEAAEFVISVLEGAAAEAGLHERTPALPPEEQEIWESVGARFDDEVSGQVRARAILAFADLVSRSVEGDLKMARLLGVDRSRVSQRVTQRSLYAFIGTGERYFPRWQLLPSGELLQGLRVVLNALDPSHHPLTVDHWFTAANVDLDIDGEPTSPVDWLATGGDPEPVAKLAAEL